MSDLEFIIAVSIMPVSTLIAAVVVYFIVPPRHRLHPGE